MTNSQLENMDREHIKNLSDEAKSDLNADPITNEPGSHPLGTGIGTTTGTVVGAAIGSLGGPLGTIVGGVVGGIVGAAGGHNAGEALDPTDYSAYWRNEYTKRPYYDPSFDYERDYSPAYRLGHEIRQQNPHQTVFNEHDTSLQTMWEKSKAQSRLTWEQAKQVISDAWHTIKT